MGVAILRGIKIIKGISDALKQSIISKFCGNILELLKYIFKKIEKTTFSSI